MEDKLSVIITVYNQNDLAVVHARECMNSLRVPDEIVVINDGGSLDLEEKLSKLDFKCRFVYARIDQDINWNYNGACNLGAWLSTGNLLAFEDNDNIPARLFYQEALEYLKNNPEVGRVTGRNRLVVSLDNILSQPLEKWIINNSIGPNQGTAIMRRDIYMLVKGQDERYCGEYGWMYYAWRRKLLNRANVKFGSMGTYYYTQDGQTQLKRNMSVRNASLMRHDSKDNVLQSPTGILNFTYKVKIFKP